MVLKPYRRIITAGSFDLFHVGHLYLLERAKDLCYSLVVLVSTDELIEEHKHIKPIIPFAERMTIIWSLYCVNYVLPQTKLVDIDQFLYLEGDMFLLGDDWKDRDDVPGIKRLKENNRIIFLPYTKSVSSSVIKERIINNADIILKAQKARNP